MPSSPQAPYSAHVLATYTRDVARWPRPSVAQQREDLVELTLRRTRLWYALLSYVPLQAQVLEQVRTITRAPLPPQRRRNGYRLADLEVFAKNLAMTPNNAELATRLVAEFAALGQNGLSPLKLSAAKREGLPERVVEIQRLHTAMLRQRDLVVARNLRLVFGVAKRFKSNTICFEDMLAEGNLGLIRAVDRFDIRHDVRFSTYAVHWIRHAVGRYVDDNSRTIRVPVNARLKYRAIRKAQDRLRAELGEIPSYQQVGERVGMKPERVEQVERDMLHPLSLDDDFGYPEAPTLKDLVPDDDPLPDAVHENRRRNEEVSVALAQLRPLHAEILRQRYGLGDDDCKTLQAIGDEMDLSRERVRQLQVTALDEVRGHVRAR